MGASGSPFPGPFSSLASLKKNFTRQPEEEQRAFTGFLKADLIDPRPLSAGMGPYLLRRVAKREASVWW